MKAVDPDSALKMYSQARDWDKCIELAKQQVTHTASHHWSHSSLPQGPHVLAKYVALYAAELIKDNAALSALKLFQVHGASPNPQNFNIYKRLCLEVFGSSLEGVAAYKTYASLRDVLLNLVS